LLKINAQNGTSNGCLQTTGSKLFDLELDSFGDETPRGDCFSCAPLRRGPDGFPLEEQGIMLNVAPVSTKNLSFVILLVRKIKPALAGKCMAVACVGTSTEVVKARQLFSFPTSHKGEHSCWPLCHNNYGTYTCHWGVEKMKEILRGGE
jgi:hypothetical protein